MKSVLYWICNILITALLPLTSLYFSRRLRSLLSTREPNIEKREFGEDPFLFSFDVASMQLMTTTVNCYEKSWQTGIFLNFPSSSLNHSIQTLIIKFWLVDGAVNG